MHISHPIVCALALVPLAAQGFVSPSHFARTEGNSADASYLSSSRTPVHVLQIHDDVPARMIRGIAFRRDGGTNSRAYAASSIIFDLEVSNAATTSASPNANFAANHGSNKVKVSSFSIARMPKSEPGESPAPFLFKLPFQTPFNYNGQGSLCVDITVRSRANAAAFAADVARISSTNPASHSKYWGMGCRYAANRSPAIITGSSAPDWRNQSMTWNYRGSSFPPNTVGTMILGGQTKTVGGIPLPFVLPGTANAPSKACTLYTDALLTIPVLIASNGSFTQTLGFQTQPYFNGGSLFSQVIARAPQANSLGLILSNVVQHNLVAPFTSVPVSSVRATNAGPVGAVTKNYGLVLEFN